jgi:hypothetical protein
MKRSRTAGWSQTLMIPAMCSALGFVAAQSYVGSDPLDIVGSYIAEVSCIPTTVSTAIPFRC